MAQCEWGTKQCLNTVKAMNIISALYLIALGVLRFIFNSQLINFLQFLLSAYYMYFIFLPIEYLVL
jgi:hypothetical protein